MSRERMQSPSGDSSPPGYSQLHTDHDGVNISNGDQNNTTSHETPHSITLFIFKIPFTSISIPITLSGLNYFTFLLIGMSNLWPWNCFLSASEYFSERLKDQPALASTYSSTMMTISTMSTTLSNIYLSQRQSGANYEFRLKIGNYSQVIIFLVMSLSTLTNKLPAIFYFIFVMVCVCLSSIGCSLIQVGCLALVNTSGSIFANAVVVGNAVAGVLPSIALIGSILFVSEQKGVSVKDVKQQDGYAILVYFLTASCISGLAIVFRAFVHRMETQHKNYTSLATDDNDTSNTRSLSSTPLTTASEGHENHNIPKNKVREESENANEDSEDVQQIHIPFLVLWGKLKFIALSIFITFAITLVFPVFASSVLSSNEENNPDSIIYQKSIFIPLAYFIWNMGDLLGRISCAYPKMVVTDNMKLLTFSLLRVIFVVLFFLCNVKGRGGFGIFNSDFVYMLLQFLFGFTNGHLFSCCFQNVPNFVQGEDEQKAAGGFTAMFVSFGLSFGSVFSYLFVYLIK